MKKFLLAFFCILLGIGLLSGCGATDYTGSADVLSQPEEEIQIEETYIAKQAIDPDQVDKAEVVYVTADANGTPEKTEVSVTLKNPGGLEPIRDVTNLKEIKNTEGNEEYTRDGKVLTWENHGADITYKGLSDKALPVTVRVTYFLNGKAIAPAALAGKSGHVKIRFDYTNTTDYVPFVCASLVMFDKDNFSSITGDGVRLLRYADQVIAFGLAVPGLKDQLDLSAFNDLFDTKDEPMLQDVLEIEADTSCFALDYTETVVMNGMFADLEDADLETLLDRADRLAEGTDAAAQLEEGIDQLAAGLNTFQRGLNAYTKGVDQCADAARQIKNGMGILEKLTSFLPANVRDSIPGLYQAIAGLSEGLDALSSNSEELRSGADSILDGCTALSNGIRTLNAEALTKLADLGGDLKDLIGQIKLFRNRDNAYHNFSGIGKHQTGSVLFMIETGEIRE